MANRKEHRFQFPGAQIARAAAAEEQYHAERANWWDAEYAKAATAAKAKGLELREFEVTGGSRHQLVVDPTLQERIDECSRKRHDHRQKADRFKMESAAYSTQAERAFELDVEDVAYFRIAGGERDP